MRVASALVLLAVAAFCAFGILATYEPVEGGAMGWRVGYAAVLVACIYGAIRLLRGGNRSR